MELMAAIRNWRAVRDYTAKAVDEETVRLLIDAAAEAPSAGDRQAWSFVIVNNRAILKRCSDAAKAELLMNRSGSIDHLAAFRDRLASTDYNIFYDAPVLIVICATEPDTMAAQSVCLAAENLMLAARDIGLGTCWIGFAEAWLATPQAKAELTIPADHITIAPIIVGYPQQWPKRPGRRTPQITWIES